MKKDMKKHQLNGGL